MEITRKYDRRLMIALVIIMLLFSVGASSTNQMIADVTLNPATTDNTLAAGDLGINSHGEQTEKAEQSDLFWSLNEKLVEYTDEDFFKVKALTWAISQKGEVNLTEEQVQRATLVDTETPLSLESSLYLVQYCDQYQVDPALVLSVIEVESNFDVNAVGSSKDRGLMQIIPSTEKWLARNFGTELGIPYNPDNIFEPEYNLGFAIRYIAYLSQSHDGDTHRALSEYNRGSKNLAKYYQNFKTYQTSYSKSILSRVDKYAFEDRP